QFLNAPPLYRWYNFKGKQRFPLRIFYVIGYFHIGPQAPKGETLIGVCLLDLYYFLISYGRSGRPIVAPAGYPLYLFFQKRMSLLSLTLTPPPSVPFPTSAFRLDPLEKR